VARDLHDDGRDVLIGVGRTLPPTNRVPARGRPAGGPPPAFVTRLGVVGLIVLAVYTPFVRVREAAGLALARGHPRFTALYKFGDSFTQSLVIPFLKNGSGFDFSNITDAKLPEAFGRPSSRTSSSVVPGFSSPRSR